MRWSVAAGIAILIYIYDLGLYQRSLSDHRKENYFRWWDVVEISRHDKMCGGESVFKGVEGLMVTCSDLELGRWLKETISETFKGREVSAIVVPAQTLFYRVEGISERRTRFLTVTWNDFMLGKESLRLMKDILASEICDADRPDLILMIKTSEETLRGSFLNFGGAYRFSEYPQVLIEELIESDSGKCYMKKRYHDSKRVAVVLTRKGR